MAELGNISKCSAILVRWVGKYLGGWGRPNTMFSVMLNMVLKLWLTGRCKNNVANHVVTGANITVTEAHETANKTKGMKVTKCDDG